MSKKQKKRKEGWMKGERCTIDLFAYESREKSCSATDLSLSLNLDQMF
jgi:hypothetical protein